VWTEDATAISNILPHFRSDFDRDELGFLLNSKMFFSDEILYLIEVSRFFM